MFFELLPTAEAMFTCNDELCVVEFWFGCVRESVYRMVSSECGGVSASQAVKQVPCCFPDVG